MGDPAPTSAIAVDPSIRPTPDSAPPPPPEPARGERSASPVEMALLLAAILTGAVLFVLAALRQPYNQNEYVQMAPYGSGDLGQITSGTRQPPLDPLIGALVQHVFGQGQLRQRIIPILAGVGTLVLLALLLRRWFSGVAAVCAIWVVVTQPIMVRYSAYARPYALPMFLDLLFIFCVQRWLDRRQRGYLATAAVTGCLLPLTRVPEPTTLLAVTALALGWFTVRRRITRQAAVPAICVAVGALLVVGAVEIVSLMGKLQGGGSSRESGASLTIDRGFDGVVHKFLPALAHQFPLWPVILLALITALAWRRSRVLLLGNWAWWPLLLSPLVFGLAFYLLNPLPALRPYHDRYSYFFVPVLALVTAALVAAAQHYPLIDENGSGRTSRQIRLAVGVLVAAALLGQLPATAKMLTDKEAADFVMASDVLRSEVPPDSIVLFDTPAGPTHWRQGFTARKRNLGPRPVVRTPVQLRKHPRKVAGHGAVYLLVLDAICSSKTLCIGQPKDWDHDIPGWRVSKRFDHFTLYAPTEGQSGPSGAVAGELALATAFGPKLSLAETFAAASVLKSTGREDGGRALIHSYYEHLPASLVAQHRAIAKKDDLNPFR